MAELAVLTVVAGSFLFFLAILWAVLPFAVFGFQPKMQKLLEEAQRTNALLSEIRGLLKASAVPTLTTPAGAPPKPPQISM